MTEELIDILKVWAIGNNHKNLVKMLEGQLTTKQYLEKVLESDLEKLPRFETDVVKSEKELRENKSKDMEKHYENWLNRDKIGLQTLRRRIRVVRKELALHYTADGSRK